MKIYEEEKRREQAELVKKGLIVAFIIAVSSMVQDYLFFPFFNKLFFFVYAVLILGSIVVFVLARWKEYTVPVFYLLVFLYVIAILLLHQQAGLMEDEGIMAIPIVIAVATFLLGWRGGFFTTTFASVLYAILVALEYFRVISGHPASGMPIHGRFKDMQVFTLTSGTIVFWYGLCVITGFFYQLIEAKREALRRSKEELTAWSDELAKRVEERTKELKEAQEKLAISEKMSALGQLGIGIAHEINNPLTIINLNAQLLTKELDSHPLHKDKDEYKIFIQRILYASNRCKEIVDDLLDFSRGFRQAKLQIVKVNLNDMVEETISLLSDEIASYKIELVKNYSSSQSELTCDPSKLKQVLANVLLNAIHSISKSGKITIVTTSEDKNIKIEIIDTGCGITKENLKRVFDPFFTTKDKGVGMGIPIAYNIIGMHKGSIDIASEVGKGTKVTIKLPRENTGLIN